VIKAVILASTLVVGNIALARYLEPEPMAQNPRWVAQQARRGRSVIAYSYARNNPLWLYDASGLDVQNNSGEGVWIVGEHGEPYYLAPGDTYYGSQDGLYVAGGNVFKTNDGVNVVVNPDGTISTFGGPPGSEVTQNTGETIGSWLPFSVSDRLGGPKDPDFTNRHPDWPSGPDSSDPGGSRCGW
jgi:hypothetical protein